MNTLLLATITLDPNNPAHISLVCFLAGLLILAGGAVVKVDAPLPFIMIAYLATFLVVAFFIISATATIIQAL